MYTLLLTTAMLTAAQAPDDKGPFKEPATGQVFPAKLGEWVRGDDRSYGEGLGVSVAYHLVPRGKATATVYVYNLKMKNIPEGPGGDAVKKQFEQAKKDVQAAQKQMGGTVAEKSEGEVSLGKGEGAPKARSVIFEIKQKDGTELLSHLYVTGWRNQFFKVRITFPKANQAAAEPAIDKLMGDLGNLIKK